MLKLVKKSITFMVLSASTILFVACSGNNPVSVDNIENDMSARNVWEWESYLQSNGKMGVVLFEHGNYGGQSKDFIYSTTYNNHWIEQNCNDFNDKASSVLVVDCRAIFYEDGGSKGAQWWVDAIGTTSKRGVKSGFNDCISSVAYQHKY